MRHLFTLLFCASTVSAAVDPALFQDLHWRLIGPFRAGRVLAVSGVPGEPEHIYFGSVNGGACARDFEPGKPRVIYAALWQTRRTPWSVYPPSNGPGSGLFKSTDGGDHWNPVQGLPAKVGRIGIAVAQSMPQRVYAVVDSTD